MLSALFLLSMELKGISNGKIENAFPEFDTRKYR